MAEDNVPPPTSDHEGKLDIPKLVDAEFAGSANYESCTLILTEGDSASSFALSGLDLVGNKEYGVCPLKGLPLNVAANPKKVPENAEVQNIVKILGLKYGKIYKEEDLKELRYGHVLLMTDQDYGGTHIKGLLINIFYQLWPSLLKVKGFLQMFVTPLIKALHKQTKKPTLFYSISEYQNWPLGNNATDYNFTYYKGLAAFDVEESEKYFTNIHEHIKNFVWTGEEDGEAIKIAFSSKKGMANKRKEWLLNAPQAGGSSYGSKDDCIRYLDFINNEYRQSAFDDVQRSISSMVDGMKRSQRKIVFCALEYPTIQETPVLVATFCGRVAEHTYYHHGETSLHGVMIRMAQDFVGCNNINLFLPKGHFGTRLQGRKFHGDARYVNAQLSDITNYLFHKDDKLLLKYLNFGGQTIEPESYCPIIPMLLVNGSDAIATAWRSFVPQYSPRDIIANIILLLKGQEMKNMLPWYKGFTGDITNKSKNAYTTQGIILKENPNLLRIKELPLRVWTRKYQQKILEALQINEEIEAYTSLHKVVGTIGHFTITMTEPQMLKAENEGLLEKFKLTSQLSVNNMHIFDKNGIIKKYGFPEEILEEFFSLRLECYTRRKVALLYELKKAHLLLGNQLRYVRKICKGKILLYPIKKDDEKCAELKILDFKTLPAIEKAARKEATQEEETGYEETTQEEETGYDYLLSGQMTSLSVEGRENLKEQRDAKKKQFDELSNTSPKRLWLRDLRDLSLKLQARGHYGDFETILEMIDAAKL